MPRAPSVRSTQAVPAGLLDLRQTAGGESGGRASAENAVSRAGAQCDAIEAAAVMSSAAIARNNSASFFVVGTGSHLSLSPTDSIPNCISHTVFETLMSEESWQPHSEMFWAGLGGRRARKRSN